MTHNLLDSVTNANGGGLSVEVTGKYTSVRHERARLDGKLTAGETAKYLKKAGIKTSAKEVVTAFKILCERDPEWHHAGFYKGSNGSTMGRTFFFDDSDIEFLIQNWNLVAQKLEEKKEEVAAKRVSIVRGFYYTWDYDYSGSYGKKVNYKVLATYEGPEIGIPKNFTSCDSDQFEAAKYFEGRKYRGWAEPQIGEFSKEILQSAIDTKFLKEKAAEEAAELLKIEIEKKNTKDAADLLLYQQDKAFVLKKINENSDFYLSFREKIIEISTTTPAGQTFAPKPGKLQWDHSDIYKCLISKFEIPQNFSKKEVIRRIFVDILNLQIG